MKKIKILNTILILFYIYELENFLSKSSFTFHMAIFMPIIALFLVILALFLGNFKSLWLQVLSILLLILPTYIFFLAIQNCFFIIFKSLISN